jgi:hypothetical protein
MNAASRVYDLCLEAAFKIHGTKPPTPAYARNTADLLFGTAAKESDLRYTRQTTPRYGSQVGAFGLWQVEPETGFYLLFKWLQEPSRAALRDSTFRFIFQNDHAPIAEYADWRDAVPAERIIGWMQFNERLGVALARLKYFSVPDPIPPQDGHAAYWLKWYNGRGCVKHHPESVCLDSYNKAYRKHFERVQV